MISSVSTANSCYVISAKLMELYSILFHKVIFHFLLSALNPSVPQKTNTHMPESQGLLLYWADWGHSFLFHLKVFLCHYSYLLLPSCIGGKTVFPFSQVALAPTFFCAILSYRRFPPTPSNLAWVLKMRPKLFWGPRKPSISKVNNFSQFIFTVPRWFENWTFTFEILSSLISTHRSFLPFFLGFCFISSIPVS